jgi:hypothetical protein
LKCTVDHILQEFYTLFLTRFRTNKITSPPQTKMTSKDDIKGLVSLKFLRPWYTYTLRLCIMINTDQLPITMGDTEHRPLFFSLLLFGPPPPTSPKGQPDQILSMAHTHKATQVLTDSFKT